MHNTALFTVYRKFLSGRLQPSAVRVDAIRVALETAMDLGQTVVLDDDGVWLVTLTGRATEIDAARWRGSDGLIVPLADDSTTVFITVGGSTT